MSEFELSLLAVMVAKGQKELNPILQCHCEVSIQKRPHVCTLIPPPPSSGLSYFLV